MRKVALNDIRIDGGTQIRKEIDQALIYQYLECMKRGDVFPKIKTTFDGASYWLNSGFHRYHAYKLLGVKMVEVDYKPGTLQDAILAALKSNTKHGKNLTIEDKENKVKIALALDGYDQKTDYELSKICDVSESFVAGVRDPAKKEKQKAAKEKHIKKKAKELTEADASKTTSQTSSEKATPRETPNLNVGANPDAAELRANEIAFQADMEVMYKLLESNEPLKLAHEEIKRLNLAYAQLDTRFKGLMNEKNQAVKMVKQLQNQLDKSKAKK
jgi:hypothetical protein